MNTNTPMHGITLEAKNNTSSSINSAFDESHAPTQSSVKLAATSFLFMSFLALLLGASLYARAESNTEAAKHPDLPESVQFMTGIVAITWTYADQDNMPFTEHHSISSAQIADSIRTDSPVRVPTRDEGELLIDTQSGVPGIILSARRYHDWTLVSVLKYQHDLTRSSGVFKFCSADGSDSECIESVLSNPDGTVSMRLFDGSCLLYSLTDNL